jgi:hypothetical protein
MVSFGGGIERPLERPSGHADWDRDAVRRNSSGPSSPAVDKRFISEKARSYANVLFSTAPIVACRSFLHVLSTLTVPGCPKLARSALRRITQMHHFSAI